MNIQRGLRFGSGIGKPWCDLYCKRGHRKFELECRRCKKMHNDINNARWTKIRQAQRAA